MISTGILTVTLDGGAPWGFRLQGGGPNPLQVLKVRKKSKAHNHLREADTLLKVNGVQVRGKSHESVMDTLESIVGQPLVLEIYRGDPLQKLPRGSDAPDTTADVANPPSVQTSYKSVTTSFKMAEPTQQNKKTERSIMTKKTTHQNIIKTSQQKHTNFMMPGRPNQQQEPQAFNQIHQNFYGGSQGTQQPIDNRSVTPQAVHPDQNLIQQQRITHQSNVTQFTQDQHNHVTTTETKVHHTYMGPLEPHQPLAGTKPKVASHLPLRPPPPLIAAKPQPFKSPSVSPMPPSSPVSFPVEDKENVSPADSSSNINIPKFNVVNLKNVVNRPWGEVHLDELHIPLPNYQSKLQTVPKRDTSPTVEKKTIVIPEMTIQPLTEEELMAKKLAGKQPDYYEEIKDDENLIVPIFVEDRPHLPVFGPPVVYGLNPALVPFQQKSVEEESVASEASSGSKKKKIYSDSSFYNDPKAVYPTIEEQINLCKKISYSLTAAANKKARGATMFAKRQKRSSKWIHDGFSTVSDGNIADLSELSSELSPFDGGTKPLFQFRIPRVAHQVSVNEEKMSLSREEFESLRVSQPKVDHRAVKPTLCSNLVADLHNNKGRGAKLFAKRQARSEKWVVDDKSVKSPSTPEANVNMMNVQNKLSTMIETPMPIIKQKPPRPEQLPNVPKAVPVPIVKTDLKSGGHAINLDGPNFNRKARGWNAPAPTPVVPQIPPQAGKKAPPPPVAPKPSRGKGQHTRSSSDQLGYCSDVDHRSQTHSFRQKPMFAPTPFASSAPRDLPGSDM
ncbi:uncharacterized protein LOC115212926 isoform X2 [Octopus sinensis]|uniref:Uncharacterized protein LOC115212926 isoform X2 n=1 Tax=Octopus sinensis TaxID=2607531 RepID=A0A6P7SI72_9MOLL|nr:uncharacterized protein LOC115212926 isoform X2 [Octopus sinensis]